MPKHALVNKGGFTLVETVVAIALTAVLSSTVLSVFLYVHYRYRDITQMNQVQASAENALDFIKESIESCAVLEITDSIAADSGEPAIWCREQILYYRLAGKNAAVYMEDMAFEVYFKNEGNLLRIYLNAYQPRGEGGRSLCAFESAVYLQNAVEIKGGEGNGIRFA